MRTISHLSSQCHALNCHPAGFLDSQIQDQNRTLLPCFSQKIQFYSVTLWYSSLGGSGHWSPGGKGTQLFSGTAVQCFSQGCPSVLLSEFRGLTSALATGRPRKSRPECPFRGWLWSLDDDLGLYTCGLTRCFDSRLSHPEPCTGRVWEEEDVNPLFPVG